MLYFSLLSEEDQDKLFMEEEYFSVLSFSIV